ncbi:MAG: hypothetical protein HYY65_10905, partial [Candidatus Tectomicrobia bacterium]|nr:hypothetical protein [Candidatus Tectomicrobia bacterium]
MAPVIEALRAEGRVTVEALAYRQACALWTKRDLAHQKLTDNITPSEVERLLQSPDAALLLTGSSFDPSLEKRFIAAARESGLPSLTVLDFWSHYALRFSDADGHLVYVPDRIAAMDKRAHAEMAA